MHKKWFSFIPIYVFLILVIAIVIVCVYKPAGKTKHVKIDYGTSNKYSQEDKEKAVEAILEQFKKDYTGCKLLRLRYDDEETENWSEGSEKEVIVFIGEFKAGYFQGEEEFFYAGQHEDEWNWVLERENSESEWENVTGGVG